MKLRDRFISWKKRHSRLHMVMRCQQNGKIEWVSKETNENGEPMMRREPNPEYVKYEMGQEFVVAGCRYKKLIQLNFGKERGKSDYLYRDAYGRKALYFKERYPCFDSFDYATESRYYHWYLFRVDDRLISVHYGDDSRWIEVRTDINSVRSQWMEEMKKIGWAI